MRLESTRSPRLRATFAQAIQAGPAPDGGLYVPEPVPCFRDVETLLAMPFRARSAEILWRFLGEEFSRAELEEVVAGALDLPLPLVPVQGRVFALELFHGPTLACKDFGARFLARMLELVAKREGGRLRTVLTATSGDTGAAVAHAFLGLKGFRTMVLYPAGRVPPLQERQIATLWGNVLAYAVDGSFDDCQALVRGAFEDRELAATLGLTSANSLNIARILAQLLTFYEAVAQLRDHSLFDPPVIAVPSGNFGSLYAGLLARATGLPVKAFVLATNANRTVPESLDGGPYRPRPSVATLSRAMDVGAPANWERIQALSGGDLEAMRAALRWGSLDDAATRRAMWELNALGYRAEPHAAVAWGVLQEHLGLVEVGVFLAPAHPAKYRDVLQEGMGLAVPLPPDLEALMDLPIRSKPLAADPAALRAELLG